MIFFYIFIAILVLVLLFFIYNLYGNVLTLQEVLEDQESELQRYFQFLESLQNQMAIDIAELEEIDRIGAFESDDEVGHFFSALRRSHLTIKDMLDEAMLPESEFIEEVANDQD